VCAEERRELSLPAAAGGLKTMGYGRMATHRPGGVLPGGHSPSIDMSKKNKGMYTGTDRICSSMVLSRTIESNNLTPLHFVASYFLETSQRNALRMGAEQFL
jgi:hypothetical protein